MPFFKKEETDILQAPNFVMGPDFELKAEEKDTYTYPVDGWYWFDTLDEAILAFSKLIARSLMASISESSAAMTSLARSARVRLASFSQYASFTSLSSRS